MNNFAISSGGIGEALERSASSLMAANNTIDESIALITAANTVVQDPAQVGTAFKTISMRIRGAKTEMSELGLDTEGMVESTAKLRSEILALTGVDIMDGANQFKSTYAIMDELAAKWQDLTDIQQATVTELIAGKRQGNIVSSLMTNFDTARDALETSLNSAGSAMAEHEKWQQSLEAKINSLKASWQSLSQAFLSSDFLKTALNGVINLVDGLTTLIDTFGAFPTLLGIFAGFKFAGLISSTSKAVGGIKQLADILPVLQLSFGKVTNGVKTFASVLKTALSSLMAHPIILAVTAAVTALTIAFTVQNKKARELAEEVDELTDKYQKTHTELQKLKNDYDTSNESSMISKYEKLSKGVDGLGRNVSLTADEYSEYQSIVNQIADQIPSLVSGYDEQGNALLSCKGNVEELTKAYEDMISAQNRAILNNAGKIGENFANKIEDNNSTGFYGKNLSEDVVSIMEKDLKKIQEGKDLTRSYYGSGSNSISYGKAIETALENAGLAEFDKWSWDYISHYDTVVAEAFEKAAKTNPKAIKSIINEFRSGLESDVAEMKNIAQATLSEAFDISDSEFYDMSDTMQGVVRNIVNGFDYEFYKQYKDNPLGVQTYINDMLEQFKSFSDTEGIALDTAFNLKTQFNSGDISYGEYINGLKNAGETIDGLEGLDKEVKSDIKLSLGLNEKGLVEEYESLVKKLSDSKNYDFKISETEAQDFLSSLSSEEFPIAVDVITQLQNNGVEETVDEIRNAIETEIAKKGLSLDLTIEKAKLNFEALSTAISESVSGSGLSEESIAAVKGMFEGLEGYNPSKLFERTANGIHLNSTELRKLNDESKKTNVAKVNKQMNSLGDIYNQTREELYQLTYGTKEYNDKLSDLNSIEQQIKDLEKLAAGYDGVASAYQEWQMIESAGSQRSMYEGILEGFEVVEDEISRGWIDDGTREFLELLYGEKTTITKIVDGKKVKEDIDIATASASDLKQAYKELNETIEHTAEGGHKGYSISDFFTVDEDGNSTSQGVRNFLDAIGHMEEEAFGGKDVVKRDGDRIIGFDFQMVGGDKVIAEALGVSEELVQIMKRASADAGFVVTLDGSFEQLDILREKAQKAAKVLNDALKGKGQEDKVFSYNFNSTDEKDITKQLEAANKALNTFKKSGKIDLSIEGASEALTVTSTLQSMLDDLQRPAYMNIEVSQVEKDLQDPLRNLQELRTLTETEHQFKISGTDTSELEKSKQEIYNYFEGLDTDVKVKLGLVDDKGKPLTGQALKDKLNAGDITIQATIDIQTKMDEKLGILVDRQLKEAGLITEEEYQKRLKIYLQGDVDNTDAKEKVENATEEAVNKDDKPSVVKKDIELIAEVTNSNVGKKAEIKIDEDVKNETPSVVKKDVELVTEITNSNIKTKVDEKVDETVKNEKSKKSVVKKDVELVAEVSKTEDNIGEKTNELKDKEKNNPSVVKKDIEIVAEVADSNVGKKVDEAIESEKKDEPITEEVTIEKKIKKSVEVLAEVIGTEDVDGLLSKLKDKDLDDKTIEAIAKVIGQTDFDKLEEALNTFDASDKVTLEVIAQAIGEGDVKKLEGAIDQLSPKTVEAIAEALGFEDVESLKESVRTMHPNTVKAIAEALGFDDVESLKQSVRTMRGNTVDAKVNTDGQKQKIDTLQGWIDGLRGKTVNIVTNIKKVFSEVAAAGKNKANQRTGADPAGDGVSDVNGTAFKQGSWGTKNSGTALVGELGREVLVRDGRYYTIGDTGAEFIKYKKGDIIFNHVQSEQLFRNGKVTAGGGRAKAFVNGTAFLGGNYPISGAAFSGTAKDGMLLPEKDSTSVDSNTENKFEDTIDWIETILDRAERAIDKYEQQANNVYKTWAKRNKALENEIAEVNKTISLYEQAKNKYLSEANAIGLEQKYVDRIKYGLVNGEDAIEDFSGDADEKTVEKIKKYEELYGKYLDTIDKIDELKETGASLYSQGFDDVQSEYDNLLQGFDHTQSMLDEYISQAEAKGQIVSKNYYSALIDNEEDRINTLKQEQAALINARDEAVANGEFDKYSEDWYRMCAEIDDVTQSIESGTTSLIEYGNAIRDIEWETFDLIQERISAVTDEADFLIELMSNKKLFDEDSGELTNEGKATMGLHGQNYNTLMYQADLAGEEAERLKQQLASAPYNSALEERYREMIALQQEYILAAEDEKNAIRDLVEEGIEYELDALQERIGLYNDALESQRDLYEYSKKVEEQTKEIASLEKQIAAYQGDNSEESQAKIQELKVSLEEARDNLEETEYDKFISDTSALLDNLYIEYETILNQRMDNTDALISEMIAEINADASLIGNTITENANTVGYILSDKMESVWNSSTTDINGVIAEYGDKFSTIQSATKLVLDDIKSSVNSMVTHLDQEAQKKTDTPKTQPSSVVNPTGNKPSTQTPAVTPNSGKPALTEDKLKGIAAAIWVYGSKAGWEDDPTRKNKLTNKLGAANAKKVQKYINDLSASGKLTSYWYDNKLKLADYSYNAFKSGAKKIDESQLAWTQEKGQEYIVRPSDGAILTPVAKGDSVLTAQASNNIWQMANSPAEFIKDNLNLSTANVPNNSNVQNSYVQHLDKVVFNMPNVHNYQEFLSEMQKDKNFERLVESMTIGKLAGKSSLAKGKAIR